MRCEGGIISNLDILITGNVKGKAVLKYSHTPFKIFKTIELGGNINKKISIDWYDDKILFVYEPKEINEEVLGELKIEYKLR